MPGGSTKSRSPWHWVNAVSGTASFAILHLAIIIGLTVLALGTEGSGTLGQAAMALLEMLLFPLVVAKKFGPSVEPILLCLPNSLLYGFVWWFTWRMFQLLFASKPAE